MSEQPTVCAVMLTRDRPELAKRAVECFRAQTYPEDSRALLIWDNGIPPDEYPEHEQANVLTHIAGMGERDIPIGALRNSAVDYAVMMARPAFDIFVHWDDDDWSHPNRITEQVALLQASRADVVGYNEMIFWREMRMCNYCDAPRISPDDFCQECGKDLMDDCGEAWLYSNVIAPPNVYALGTSLMYWRKTWERHQFADETQGVEDHWLREKKVTAVSSLGPRPVHMGNDQDDEPRMIARIHGGNTSNGYKLDEYAAKGAREWKRVLLWDDRVREVLR